MLIAVNIIFIPKYGYMACAWGGVAGYGTATLLSYFVGQRKYPIRYPLGSIFVYILIAAAFTALMMMQPVTWPAWERIGINSILILLFIGHIIYHEWFKLHKTRH